MSETKGPGRGGGRKKRPSGGSGGAKGGGAKKPRTAEASDAAAKRSLPAFGFAADVLGPAAAEIDPVDPERIYAFADALANRDDETAEQGPAPRLETWVTFALDAETYALPVRPIQEVLRVSAITRVPHAPQPIRGVTQLRGRVIPVIDLRQRLGLPSLEKLGRGSRILVVASKRRLLGLLVDRVFQVEHIDLNRVQPPPPDVVSIRSDFIFGVDQRPDRLLLLLDADRVLVVHDHAEDS